MMRTLLILLALTRGALAADPMSVLLQGHDDPIVGYLRQVSESRFFLQSDDDAQSLTYEVDRSAIVSVNGRKEIPDAVRGDGQVIEYSTLETILPNGDVEVWSQYRGVNDIGPRTEVAFGAKEHELPSYRTMEVRDQWGNELKYRIDKVQDALWRVTIAMEVPAAARETIVMNIKTMRPGAARREGDVWVYRRNTDFPDDRIFTRKVRLPAGAEFVTASHQARPWSDILPLTVSWRRFCPKRTDDVMTLTYRLP